VTGTLTIFALFSAVLYGTADFLGGAAARRAAVLGVLVVSVPFGATIIVAAALLAGSPWPAAPELTWGAASGVVGGLGLIVFYAGLAAGPMSLVAPLSALVATLLPVGVAMAGGERPPGPAVLCGMAACLAAIVLVSMERRGRPRAARDAQHPRRRVLLPGRRVLLPGRRVLLPGRWVLLPGRRVLLPGRWVLLPGRRVLLPGRWVLLPGRRVLLPGRRVLLPGRRVLQPGRWAPLPPAGRGLLCGLAAGTAFGLFFVLVKHAAPAGGFWPLVASRAAGTLVVAAGAALTRSGPPRWSQDRRTVGMALLAGAFDASANLLYVLAVSAGLFTLAVVLTSLYPAVTVLFARVVLGERMRRVQRAGLFLAAVGIVLVTAA
jgi:drug/metabolite transporter (DMT)-like permease